MAREKRVSLFARPKIRFAAEQDLASAPPSPKRVRPLVCADVVSGSPAIDVQVQIFTDLTL
jgi:hypothetical protein